MAKVEQDGFDRVAGSAMLVISAPLMALIAVAIRLISGKPVLYRYRRPGYRSRIFTLYSVAHHRKIGLL